ncbi:DUF2199 domain-containing protein [Nonomuraea sp. NPDC050556]|uniref:DUF2199 domain-containing protein n=1 Tax=Nonomuraea sp. NPDC050556 TaxID=3364369 RepID=UPI0037B64606
MTINAVVSCSCCGAPLPDTDQIDVRFGLPDVALALPDTARHSVNSSLLRVDGHGCFIRCLLPVHLSGELTLMLGTWMRIGADDLERTHAVWDEPAYADLVLSGTLANAIEPWGEELLGADLTAVVRNEDEIPYADASNNPLLSQVMHTVWNRDDVLRCFGHALPVSVRTWLDERWSIERSAGMSARVVDGAAQFTGLGRAAHVKLRNALHSGWTPMEFLAALTKGAPGVDAAHQLTEEYSNGLRHAFWLTSTSQDRTQYEFYGYAIHRDTAVALACVYDDPEDLSWAQHVWRSVTHASDPSEPVAERSA